MIWFRWLCRVWINWSATNDHNRILFRSNRYLDVIKNLFRQKGLPVGTEENPIVVIGSAPVPTGLEGGLQIGRESGLPVESDHPLSQFVSCLRDPRLQKDIIDAKSNLVIELSKGIVWLGDDKKISNQLFMRPCYFDLLEAKEEYFKLNSSLRAVVYTGTPGIGKSHLCAFVVAQKLIAGKAVFFERVDKDVEERAIYRLHLVSGVHIFKSSLILDSVSRDENAVYIVDGGFAGFPRARVETQIFASPSEALYRPERKVWPSYLYLDTPLFDLEEFQSMRSAVSAFQGQQTEMSGLWRGSLRIEES